MVNTCIAIDSCVINNLVVNGARFGQPVQPTKIGSKNVANYS